MGGGATRRCDPGPVAHRGPLARELHGRGAVHPHEVPGGHARGHPAGGGRGDELLDDDPAVRAWAVNPGPALSFYAAIGLGNYTVMLLSFCTPLTVVGCHC
jgi:hypothetical protein